MDLDNTLVPEMENYQVAFEVAAGRQAGRAAVGVGAVRSAVFGVATDLWYSSPVAAYCVRVGLGCPTSLLSDFPGPGEELAYLRSWAGEYRHTSWSRGLERVGMAADLAGELDEAFRRALRRRCPPYGDVLLSLEQLSDRHEMAVVTNGPDDVQHAKLVASGLLRFFPRVIASTEIGSGKPEPAIFQAAVERLGIAAEEAIVVGDSLEKDIAGARAAGLRSVWLNRSGAPASNDVLADAEVSSFAELPRVLERDNFR